MIGAIHEVGGDPTEVFSGIGHAPPALTPQEAGFVAGPMPEAVRLDCPDWLHDRLRQSLDEDFEPVLSRMRNRAPVFLRVNIRKADLKEAVRALEADGIAATAHPLATAALEVTNGARRLRQSAAYQSGMVELQDASSQAVIESLLPIAPGARVLDFCAGGGGKALALASATGATVYAHDANPRRMADMPERAERAGADIRVLNSSEVMKSDPWDLILIDVPCSGSGAWRRQPDAKWRMTEEQLTALCQTQAEIMDAAAPLVRPDGRLAYVTCSILKSENDQQVAALLSRNLGWSCTETQQWLPIDDGDGFYLASLTRE